MVDASICGLGQAAPNPALSVIKYFPQEIRIMSVAFTLNGTSVESRSDETLLQSAKRYGVEIPHLCYTDGMRADGNCRACMVEIKGERVLAPSCCRYPTDGNGSHHQQPPRGGQPEDGARAAAFGRARDSPTRSIPSSTSGRRSSSVGKPRFAARHQPAQDLSHPAIAVHLDACIQCGRCVRACRETQVNDVIGYAFRGAESKIVFDLDDPMGNSTCVACGECVQACPTGALMPARDVGTMVADKEVESVCPYCGVGCQLTYHVKENTILFVQGKDGPANSSRLCVKGRYGFDYVQHRHRLTTPLIRKPGVRKHKNFTVDPDNWQRRVPRGDLGGSARCRRERPAHHPRHARQEIARRVRVGERHERGSLPVPEAGPHGFRIE